MQKRVNQWAARFKNHKFTPQRRIILEVFLENKTEHMSADDVFRRAKEKDTDIGLATIYRTLELLEEMAIIHKLHFGDGCSRYELVLEHQDEHHHHHLICLSCRSILEVEEDLLHQLEQLIVEKKDFQIMDHRVQFYGYCRDCQKKEKE